MGSKGLIMSAILSVVVFLMIFPKIAWALSEAECAEIAQKYGVVSPACRSADPGRGVITGTIASGPNPQGVNPRTRLPDALRTHQIEENVFFPLGGAQLDQVAKDRIAAIAKVLETQLLSNTCVQLVGHSDASGSEARNLEIGLERARSVALNLKSEIGSERVESLISQGEWALLTNLPGSHAYQRRVEVRVRKCVD